MVKRKRIGIIYKMEKGWMGGTYYILNLITALNTLPDDEKPTIVVLCKKEDFNDVIKYTGYPYLEYGGRFRLSFRISVMNKLYYMFFGKRPFRHPAKKTEASIVFPFPKSYHYTDKYVSLAWIPDFQEKYYPQFFDKQEIIDRDMVTKMAVESGMPILFSSQNALNDFNRFYTGAKNQTFVMRFAVSLPDRDQTKDQETLVKYDADEIPYLFCANQFWQHKNHQNLFKAVKVLKARGIRMRLYCSGNTKDYRTPDYFPMLQKYIKDNQLEDYIHILGFMDRGEQLCLMAHAWAIVQPSYFEGWSTVVEDAKALHKYVVLSDIPLHREQLKENVSFFNPDDPEDLADKMEEVLRGKPIMSEYNYGDNIKEYGRCFMQIVTDLTE